jgi:hypothetical protein
VSPSTLDGFQRYGAGATLREGKAEVNVLLQGGWDSGSGPAGNGQHSSAGFAQLRWGFTPALTAVLRGDAANGDAANGDMTNAGTANGDSTNLRTLTSALIIRTHANSKLVLEGVYGRTSALNMEFFLSN